MEIPWDLILNMLFIFCARATDVTVGVFRILMLVRGRRVLAAVLGFFEVMVFLSVMGIILGGGKSLSLAELLAYCGGFATGNIIGVHLEEKLLDAMVLVEVICEKNENAEEMVRRLREAGFGTTVLTGEGRNGPRIVAKVVCGRTQIGKARDIAGGFGFFFVSDVKGVSGGHFTHGKRK